MDLKLPSSVITCPRCRNTMVLLVQSEMGSKVITTYMYVCTVCRYRKVVERVEIGKNGDKLIVSVVRHVPKTS